MFYLTFANDDYWNFEKKNKCNIKINIYAFIQIYDFNSFLTDFN